MAPGRVVKTLRLKNFIVFFFEKLQNFINAVSRKATIFHRDAEFLVRAVWEWLQHWHKAHQAARCSAYKAWCNLKEIFHHAKCNKQQHWRQHVLPTPNTRAHCTDTIVVARGALCQVSPLCPPGDTCDDDDDSNYCLLKWHLRTPAAQCSNISVLDQKLSNMCFWCSTIVLDTRPSTCMRRHAYPWRVWVKQRRNVTVRVHCLHICPGAGLQWLGFYVHKQTDRQTDHKGITAP